MTVPESSVHALRMDAPDLVHSERDVLLRYLRKNRAAVVRATQGLPEEQLRRPGVPSGTSLLGLVHHLTGVEQHWFQHVFLGRSGTADLSMTVPDDRTRDDVVAAYAAECARSDEVVRSCADLSTLAAVPNPGEDDRDALRLVLAHLVEETARHAGHADILRERLDGVTGL